MYDFHYNFMLKHIERKNIDLLFTDTDSLCYHIRGVDINAFMLEHRDKFDVSNYPKDSPMYDVTNMKVIGKAKNESPKHCITEFVGLRAKLYSYTKNGCSEEEKRCKGVKTCVRNNALTFDMYKDCLFNRSNKTISQNGIRSYGHQLYSETVSKVGLSYCDDKVYICDDNINTYNYGHKMLDLSHSMVNNVNKFNALMGEVNRIIKNL